MILTNRKNSFKKSTTIETGLSGHHKMIITMMIGKFKKKDPKIIKFRCYKNFDIIYFGMNRKTPYGIHTRRWIMTILKGHLSLSRLPKYMLDWIPTHGRRSAGRRRITLFDCLTEDLQWFSEIDGCDIKMGKEWAQDRRKWKKLVKVAKKRLQTCEQADPHG